MADDSSDIVQHISLEGADDVIKKLEAIGNAGQDLSKKLYGQGGVGPGGQAIPTPAAPKPAAPHVAPKEKESFGEDISAIEIFRKSIHSLHPALHEAGIEMGALSGLMFAARSGIVVLATAISGLLITALEKSGDAANDAANKLGVFAGSPERGKQQLKSLEEPAQALGTSNEKLAGPFGELGRINQQQPQSSQLQDDRLVSVLSTLIKGAQADRLEPSKQVSSVTELLTSVRESGQLTKEAFDSAAKTMPQLMKSIADELSKIKPAGQPLTTAGQFLQAATNAGPEVSKRAAATKEAFPESISDAWEHVSASSGRLEHALGDISIIAGTLNKLASFFDAASKGVEEVRSSIIKNRADRLDRVSAAKENVRKSFVGLDETAAAPPRTGQQSLDALKETFGAFDAKRFTSDLEEVRNGFNEVGGSVDKANKEFINNANQLSSIGKSLGLAKAKLDAEFEPKETEIKLKKDEAADKSAGLAIKSAEINAEESKKRLEESQTAVKTAQLNKVEAEKGVQLAQFAVGDAHAKSEDAGLNLRQAQLNLRIGGGKPDADDKAEQTAINQQKRLAALDAAEVAARKAKIEEQYAYLQPEKAENDARRAGIEAKYSYLEPQKAQVDVEKTQAEIKSAKLEKEDTSLKLAKDEQGAPLSHDYSMLKYAQAQVDLDAEILKSHETSNKTLSQIEQDLEAILRQGSLSGQKSSTAPSAAAPSAAAPSAAAPSAAAPSAAAPSAAAPGGVKPENDFTFSQPVKPENDFTGRQPVNPENDFTTNADKVGSVFDKLATSGEKAADNLDKVPVPKDSVDSDVQQRAGGGEIHGVGTGTSDGVHVMASAGEFFHKTAAVQHYGLPFMHAVNNMQLPKFSLGGLVDGLSTPLVALDLPHFAEGGPVMASPGAGLHPVPIHFNGQHVGTLFGTPDAVSQMQARSTMDQIANLGPKPSHYSR